MIHTKVFATKKEIAAIQKLAQEAASTPVMALSSAAMLSGRDFASLAWERAKKYAHTRALAHGLPEIEGYYGLTEDGEFVSA